MEHIIAQRGGFEISTDPARLDLDLVCGVLAKTYWAEGIAVRVGGAASSVDISTSPSVPGRGRGKTFVNFSPGISNQAAKAIRQTIRDWRLNCRIDKRLDDLARMLDSRSRMSGDAHVRTRCSSTPRRAAWGPQLPPWASRNS